MSKGDPQGLWDRFRVGGRMRLDSDVSCHLQTKCFICGIGSDYFDTTPHGFETHTLEEHNLANYM